MSDLQHTLWYGDAEARGAFFDKLENALCLAWDIAFFESQSSQIPSYKVALETQKNLSDLISNVRKAKSEYMKEVERKEKEKQENRGSYYSPHQENHGGWFRGL